MGDNSKIEWTQHTFNPWMGCTKVSPACMHCYAERDMDKWLGKVKWGPNGTRVLTGPQYWQKPLKWNREAEKSGTRARVFCASLADVFEDWEGPLVDGEGRPMWLADQEPDRIIAQYWKSLEELPQERANIEKSIFRLATMDDVRHKLFKLIDATPHLDWLLLTKRPENIRRMLVPHSLDRVAGHVSQNAGDGYHVRRRSNVWLGATVENQDYANDRVPELLKCHDLSPVLFLSCEPLLERVNLGQIVFQRRDPAEAGNGLNDWIELYGDALTGSRATSMISGIEGQPKLDWVIAGGESGDEPRPSHPDWFRSLRDQCRAAGVPFLFKQWGEWADDSRQQPILPLMDEGRRGMFVAGEWRANEGPWARYENLALEAQQMYRVGKKAAGRLLDGREHNEFPTGVTV